MSRFRARSAATLLILPAAAAARTPVVALVEQVGPQTFGYTDRARP